MNFTVNQFIRRAIVTTTVTATVLGTTSGILSGLLLATATPASAKQFKKLLQLGQTVPGNNQPVEEIIEPTIGLDQQVAVLLKTKTVQTDPGPPGSNIPSTTTFKGIYSIGKDGQIRLMDGGASTAGFGGANRQEFSAPSISQGKIAYVATTQSEGRGGLGNRLTTVRVGTPGQVKTALSLNLSATPAISGLSNLAFVNGKAYFLDKGNISDGGPLGVIDTLAATPSLQILKPGNNIIALRASSQSLAAINFIRSRQPIVELLESPGDSNFKVVASPASSSGNCGFSVSFDNLVSCTRISSPQGSTTNLFVRFGRGGAINTIPIPPNPAPLPPSEADRVSISNRSVIFFSKEFRANSPNVIDTIYLSENGQTPTPVIKAGDRLDGKTVSELALSENGRTIAGKSIVFTATFTDGTRALYRVDL